MKMYTLSILMLVVLLGAQCGRPAQQPVQAMDTLPCSEITQLTSGPLHHFASAYYHIRSWDASGRYLLCLRTDIADRNPEVGDTASLCMIDSDSGEVREIARTSAWNFQQGTMQQWLGSAPDSMIIFNDCREGKLVAVIMNAFTGRVQRVIDRPVSAVSHDGLSAVSINFSRLHQTRPGYGYAGPGQAARLDEDHPADEGLFRVDLETGNSKLIVSLDQVFALNPPPGRPDSLPFWFNHTLINRDDSRVFFLGRRAKDGGGWCTASYTVGLDGEGLRCVLDYDWGGSHFDWLSDERLLVTCWYQGSNPLTHLLFSDTQSPNDRDYRVLGQGMLTNDGHGRFSNDGRWMVTDTYPMHGSRSLMLMRMSDDALLRLGTFNDHTEIFDGAWRCDLHPAFDKSGRRLVFDSVDDGTRQVYLAKLNYN
jgi:hypothetical protein